MECGADSSTALGQCQDLCSSLSADELECIEESSCESSEECLSEGGTGTSSGGPDPTGTPSTANIGDACSCGSGGADFEQCSGTDGPCGTALTCDVVFGEGVCSQPCTVDTNAGTDDCPVGECVLQVVQDVEVGSWCE